MSHFVGDGKYWATKNDDVDLDLGYARATGKLGEKQLKVGDVLVCRAMVRRDESTAWEVAERARQGEKGQPEWRARPRA